MQFIVISNFGIVRNNKPVTVHPGSFVEDKELDSLEHVERLIKMKMIAAWDPEIKNAQDETVGGKMSLAAFAEAKTSMTFRPVPVVEEVQEEETAEEEVTTNEVVTDQAVVAPPVQS